MAWDMDGWCLSSTPIANSRTLADRLSKLLISVVAAHPLDSINPAAYGMHSLRRGGVQAAWAAGVEISKIKAHGRWRSDTGMLPYLVATRDIKLQVTFLM